MSRPTHKNEYILEVSRIKADSVDQKVEDALIAMARDAYGAQFIFERYWSTVWFINPRKRLFVEPEPYLCKVELKEANKNVGSGYFGEAPFYLLISFRTMNNKPTDETMKIFSSKLLESTGLPIWCMKGAQELFYGNRAR